MKLSGSIHSPSIASVTGDMYIILLWWCVKIHENAFFTCVARHHAFSELPVSGRLRDDVLERFARGLWVLGHERATKVVRLVMQWRRHNTQRHVTRDRLFCCDVTHAPAPDRVCRCHTSCQSRTSDAVCSLDICTRNNINAMTLFT